MGILYFTEIKDGEDFEIFACEFLPLMGLKVIEGPDRGADEGRDIIAVEVREDKEFRWLVSCKHFANADSGNGRSVSKSDELDIRDRTEFFDCNGFISFCSTIQANKLNKYAKRFVERGVLDKYLGMHRGTIEPVLLLSEEGERLAKRYFKDSYNIWVRNGKVASSTYHIQKRILMLQDNHKDIIIANLQMISNAKSLLMGNIPINIKDIEEVEKLINEALNVISYEGNESYALDEIQVIFEKANMITDKIASTIKHYINNSPE